MLLINHQPDIDKIYLYAKNQYEAKYQLLINKVKLKHCHDPKAFTEYSNDMDDIYNNIDGQVITKHDWTPVKYLNVLHHNITQKQLQHFFLNIMQKHYQLPILGTLDMSGHFHQKQ